MALFFDQSWERMVVRPSEGRGFTLVEIVIVMAILVILSVLAIPPMLRSRMTANESVAINACRMIVASSQAYHGSSNPHTYPGSLSELTAPVSDPPYIDSILAAATSTDNSKQGYYYTYVLVGSAQFTLNADPVVSNVTGSRHFFVDEAGVIRVNPNGPAGPTDPPVE